MLGIRLHFSKNNFLAAPYGRGFDSFNDVIQAFMPYMPLSNDFFKPFISILLFRTFSFHLYLPWINATQFRKILELIFFFDNQFQFIQRY